MESGKGEVERGKWEVERGKWEVERGKWEVGSRYTRFRLELEHTSYVI